MNYPLQGCLFPSKSLRVTEKGDSPLTRWEFLDTFSRFPRVFRHQAAIALCVLSSACDREEHEALQGSSRRSAFSTRSMASDPQRTLQQEIDAADQDPLIQQRLADFMRDLDEDHGNANDPNHPGWRYHRKEAEVLGSPGSKRLRTGKILIAYAAKETNNHPDEALDATATKFC
jgi:hypothetical protein